MKNKLLNFENIMRTQPASTIQNEVIKIISRTKEIKPSRLRTSANLSKFGFDTVDVVDIILELEKNFHIVIPDEVKIDTVGDFVDYVSSHTPQPAV
jgi:acyl carrier protein